MKLRSLSAVIAAGLTALGLAVAPQAAASPNSLVAFGDSVMANPELGDYLAGEAGSVGADPRGRPTDSDGFAKQAAWHQGLSPHDYSCARGTC